MERDRIAGKFGLLMKLIRYFNNECFLLEELFFTLFFVRLQLVGSGSSQLVVFALLGQIEPRPPSVCLSVCLSLKFSSLIYFSYMLSELRTDFSVISSVILIDATAALSVKCIHYIWTADSKPRVTGCHRRPHRVRKRNLPVQFKKWLLCNWQPRVGFWLTADSHKLRGSDNRWTELNLDAVVTWLDFKLRSPVVRLILTDTDGLF